MCRRKERGRKREREGEGREREGGRKEGGERERDGEIGREVDATVSLPPDAGSQ